MKIRLGRERGSVLVTALVLSAIVGIVLGSYYFFVSNHYKMSKRSEAWNLALPTLEAGIEEKLFIDLKGNNLRVDSFDSTDNTYSTGGRYDPNKIKDGGNIGTNLGFTNSDAVNIGNADIYGKVATGPGGTVDVGSQGSI